MSRTVGTGTAERLIAHWFLMFFVSVWQAGRAAAADATGQVFRGRSG
jgi:hypothetical protein